MKGIYPVACFVFLTDLQSLCERAVVFEDLVPEVTDTASSNSGQMIRFCFVLCLL